MNFPQNIRNIPRIILVLVIIAGFGMALAGIKSERSQVKGVKAQEAEYLKDEIDKTRKVIAKQPGYADAWVKLSVLYEQIGETELSKRAMETAKKLNPDL